MEITINEERRLFIIPAGEGYTSCAGFDNVYNWCRQLATKLVQKNILSSSIFDEIAEEGKGTLEQYQLYLDLENKAKGRNLGTFFSVNTPKKVQSVLEAYRKSDERIRIFYGDRETGRDWLEEYGMVGRVGRSTGTMKIPLLVADGEDGVPGMLDDCIVRMIDADTRKEVYRHPKYHQGAMEIRSTEGEMASVGNEKTVPLSSLGYTHGAWVDGVNHANFTSFGKAAQWVAFMTGECMEQPE